MVPGAALLACARITASHGGVPLSRLHRLLALLLRVALFEPLRVIEQLRFDKAILRHRPPDNPIFVLGHWRSGTSHLQGLLSLDERHATCSLAQCLFADCMLTTKSWLPAVIDNVATALRIRYPIQDTPLRSSLPAEEEIAMLSLMDPASSNWGQIFPASMRDHATRPADDASWADAYRYIVNKLSIAHGDTRLVLKSPMNTARVELLARLWPRAVFVHVHRHPLDVFASSRRLWQTILRLSALQKIAPEAVDEMIIDVYEHVNRRYLEQRAAVEPGRIIDVAYEDLRTDGLATIDRVYRELGLGPPPTNGIVAHISANPAPRFKPRNIEAELEATLQSRWAFAFEAWDYD